MTGTRMDYGDGVMVTAWQDACAGLVAQEIVKPSALWRPPDPLETRTAAALTILEGYRDTWYRCSEGAWTIGYGHSVSDPAPPYEWTNLFDQVHFVALLLADIRRAEAAAADNFGFWRPEGPKGPDVWWSTFSAVQQRRAQALIEMAFQLGGAGQRGFKRMWQAVHCAAWDDAGAECLESLWHRQTPARAKRVAAMLASGRLDADALDTTLGRNDPFAAWRDPRAAGG